MKDPGYPDSILLDGNASNQITNFIEQTARLAREGNTVIIGISTSDLSAALSGAHLGAWICESVNVYRLHRLSPFPPRRW